MASQAKRRGGWPKTDRERVLLRIDKDTLDWFTEQAGETGKSRNDLLRLWLVYLHSTVRKFEQMHAGRTFSLSDLRDFLGTELSGDAISLGVVASLVKRATAADEIDELELPATLKRYKKEAHRE